MGAIEKIWIAYLLDLLLGDPYWFPHPVRFIGFYISTLERYLYRFKLKKIMGGFLAITVIFTTMAISFYLTKLSNYVEIFLLYTTLATKSLGKEGKKIYNILKKRDLELAKREISYLVSRETDEMNEEQIIKSTVETIAENSVDGVIAPLFYAMLGAMIEIDGINLSLSFAMGYKAINTLDSMLGYKNERYIDFGYLSAKIDDVFNFIPSRITGAIFVPISSLILGMGIKNSLKIFFRDRNKHSSPNSGQSESAFAGAMGIQFGGKTKYFGKYQDKAKIGDMIKEFDIEDIKKASRLMYLTSFIGILFFSSIVVFIKGVG